MKRDISEAVERLECVRDDVLGSMMENELQPEEALTLLSTMLIQIYYKFVENNSRDNFLNVLGQSYDTYALINAEPQGGVQ